MNPFSMTEDQRNHCIRRKKLSSVMTTPNGYFLVGGYESGEFKTQGISTPPGRCANFVVVRDPSDTSEWVRCNMTPKMVSTDFYLQRETLLYRNMEDWIAMVVTHYPFFVIANLYRMLFKTRGVGVTQ